MKKHLQKTKFVWVLVAMMATPAFAQDELSPLVVTAGRIAENPANVSSDVTIISQEDIKNSQATNVADLLRTQVGIDVAASGGVGKATSVFIRGGNSGHTLVLIDGVRVGSVTTGSFDWGNLSTTDIERIEIVRGAQSSLYGADAMGGVIQIFTRKGKKGVHTQVSAELGSYGTRLAGVSVQAGSDSGVRYALSAETLKSNGFSVAANGTEADAYDRTTLSGSLGVILDKGNVTLSLRQVEGSTGLDGGFPFGDVLDYTQKNTQTVSAIKASFDISETLETTLQVSRSIDDAAGKDPVTAWNNYDFKTTIDQITWQNHWALNTTSVLFGLDIHKDSGKSISAGLDESLTQQALFVSLASSLDVADVNLSVRHDKNSVSDNQTTYKVGSVFHAGNGFDVIANYGTGFKAPSINDLYFPNNFGSQGNPNLKSETSKGWDVGVSYAIQKETMTADVSVVYFKQNYKNLIAWVETPPGSFAYIPANINAATTKGTEISANLDYGIGFLRLNWTNLDATDDTTGLWLVRRAQDSGSVTLGVDVASLHAEVQSHLVGKRYNNVANTVVMDKYQKTDVRLSYKFGKVWTLKGRVENIEDVTYEEVSGYGVSGRATYVGLAANF